MDGNPIDRIRDVSFAHAVRGYDRHEVDLYLSELADWLERGGEEVAASSTVRVALERVGELTASILTDAHDAAEAIRDDATAEVRQALIDANATAERLHAEADEHTELTRGEADDYARKTRAEAEGYAEQTRAEAIADATGARAEAKREGERIVNAAHQQRRDIEAVIGDLELRRDAVIEELEKLASGITGAASKTRIRIEADSIDEATQAAEGPVAERDEADPEADEPTRTLSEDEPTWPVRQGAPEPKTPEQLS